MMVQGYMVLFFILLFVMLLLSHDERASRRILALPLVQAMEKRLAKQTKYYWVGFALCMVVGAFVRLYRFGQLPYGLNQDGAMAGVEALSLAMNGTDQHGISWPTYFMAWQNSQMSTLYSYLLIPFVKVFGLAKSVLRLPMVLVSMATLPLMWDFARRMFGKGYALIVLFLTAVCPWHIVTARWALEANLLPHVLLLAMYLLYIGRQKRWALYLSMVFFALTPYAYGVACYITPVILLGASVYYLARGKVRWGDVAICLIIFFAISGPYFYTMAINALGWETATIGPFTMPRFPLSNRSEDMAFLKEDVYRQSANNLYTYIGTFLTMVCNEAYNVTPKTGVLYRFMAPAILCGFFWLWYDRRRAAWRKEDSALRDAGMLLLLWLAGTLVNGIIVDVNINRNNTIYYALLFVSGYALFCMGRKIKTFLLVAVMMLGVGFAFFCGEYFFDTAYQQTVGTLFRDQLNEALVDTWDWDYDTCYVFKGTKPDEDKIMETHVLFARQIDAATRRDERELLSALGTPSGWYYTQRYVYTDFVGFAPDPMECALYIITQKEKVLFDEADFLLYDYKDYAVAYPRYWAE